MQSPYFDAKTYVDLDGEAVARYNARRSVEAETYLHFELGPHPFDGDIENAKVVLLMGNPGYDKTSTLEDHRFQREGWPISSLHPEAPPGMRNWYVRRLRWVIEIFGAQHVSQQLAIAQLQPWASNGFDNATVRLPSASLIADPVKRAIERGAVVIGNPHGAMWSARLGAAYKKVEEGNSHMQLTLGPGNLTRTVGLWNRVLSALDSKSAGIKTL
ncbi:hypothetical protein BH11PSE13_BH11PSE13_35050 [soil metagenome]